MSGELQVAGCRVKVGETNWKLRALAWICRSAATVLRFFDLAATFRYNNTGPMKAEANPELIIFEAARLLAADQRGAYLELACAATPALRPKVQSLLDA